MNQSPAQVARLFFYLLNFSFASALRFRPLLCIPLSWCLAAFAGALRFLQNRAPRGATKESILRLCCFVNYFFQLFSSNAGERVRVNLSIFAVHNEGSARQNFLKLHASGTAFHDLCGAPALYEKSVRLGRAGRRYGVFVDCMEAALRLGGGADARLFPVDCGGFAGFRKQGEVLAARRALCVGGAPLGIIAELPKRTCRAVFRA